MARSNDLRQLLARQLDLATGVARQDQDASPSPPHLLCITRTITTYPTTPNVFYGVTPQALLGTEAEGAAGVLTAGSVPFYALNIGGSVPPPGTQVLAVFIGNRWIFRYG